MVGRQRAKTGRQCRTTEIAELFGMQLDRQAVAPRRREDALRLRRGKTDALAEGIHRIGKPRSEERRVGKECVSTCRSLWSQNHSNKTKDKFTTIFSILITEVKTNNK